MTCKNIMKVDKHMTRSLLFHPFVMGCFFSFITTFILLPYYVQIHMYNFEETPHSFSINLFILIAVVAVYILLHFFIKKITRTKVQDYKDLADIVLLVGEASAKIYEMHADSEIYKAVNNVFEASSTFDCSIHLLTEDKKGLSLEQFSMSDCVKNNLNFFFKKFRKISLYNYILPLERIPTYDKVISEGGLVYFKRSTIFKEVFGSLSSTLVTIMGDSENIGFAIKRFDTVIGIINITSPKLLKDFMPSALNLSTLISRQLEASEIERQQLLIKHELIEKNEALSEAISEANALRIEADCANRAKSEFLANMSHEIRTPLNAIMGFTSNILEESLSADHREQLLLVQRSSHYLHSLINDVLDLSKIEANEISIESISFSLKDLLEEVISSCRVVSAQSEKKIAIRLEYDKTIAPTIIGDPTRLQQIFMNLVGNAIKFTHEGFIEVIVTLKSEILHFEVRDSGIGIPVKKQKLIFEPFKQADSSTTRQYGGTGLGLALTQKLIALMEGELQLFSNPPAEKGSCFFFDILYRPAISLAEPVKRASATEKNGHKGALSCHILVVEDNHINQLLAKRLLEKRGYSVTLAENGEEAIKKYLENDFDIILMDIQMPILDGYEDTKRLRIMNDEANTYIPIVAMTANAMADDRKRCLDVGMDDYITKPIEINHVVKVIRHYCSP